MDSSLDTWNSGPRSFAIFSNARMYLTPNGLSHPD